MWSFQGSSLVFGLEISKGCNINNFTKFPEVEFSFRNFQGNREKPKQFHAFFPKKVCPQHPIPSPPVWCFFPRNIPFQNNWIELVLWGTCQERSIDHISSRAFASFMIFVCSIIIISFKKVHTSVLWYQLIRERISHSWEVKKPPFVETATTRKYKVFLLWISSGNVNASKVVIYQHSLIY